MRATDMHLKLEYLRSTHGERVATLATGTPIANSITEAQVMQRYLRPDLFRAAGVENFVLFEASMAMGRDAGQTVLGEVGDLRPFSDVGGRRTVQMDNTAQRRKSLADRLRAAVCPVDISGPDWINAGDFTPSPKPGNGLPLGKRLPSRDRNAVHVDGHWYAGSGSSFDHV